MRASRVLPDTLQNPTGAIALGGCPFEGDNLARLKS